MDVPFFSDQGTGSLQISVATSRNLAALITMVLLSLSSAAPQDSGGASGQPLRVDTTVHSTSVLVVVDVAVTDHGHPVEGLAKEDFKVFENGREQTLKVFEEHKPAEVPTPQSPPALPANTYSNFPVLPSTSAVNVLLLDAMNTPLQDQMYVRKEMVNYLKNIPPHSCIAIFTLGSRLRLVEGFTEQPESLIAGLMNKKQISAGSTLLPDPDDSTAQQVVAFANNMGSSADGLSAIQQFQADTAVFQADLRVRNTLDALNALADYLSPISERKNVIWLSGSFPISFDPNPNLSNEFSVQREYSREIQTTSGRLTAARIALYPVDVRGLLSSSALSVASSKSSYSGVTQPGASAASTGRPVEGRRAGQSTRVRASGNNSNPNSFAADDAKFMQQTTREHQTMQQLAEETGGVAYYDKNGIQEAVAQAMNNGANYYTLVYTPDDKNFDGSFRKIRVEVANAEHTKKDYQLAYRRGYYGNEHNNPARIAALTPTATMIQRGAPPSYQILFKVRILAEGDPALAGLKPEPGPAGFLASKLKGRVKRYWIDFAGDMHQVEFSPGSDGLRHGALEVVALAYDHDGKLLNVVNRTLKLNLQPAQYDKVMQTGLPVHEELDLPGGEVYLRVGIHDLSTDRIGTTEFPLKVNAR